MTGAQPPWQLNDSRSVDSVSINQTVLFLSFSFSLASVLIPPSSGLVEDVSLSHSLSLSFVHLEDSSTVSTVLILHLCRRGGVKE